MTRFIAFATVITTALVLAACGSEDSAPRAAQSTGDLERYCALVREMDAAGSKFFARIEAKKNATPADFEAAERRFVERFTPQFEAIEHAAPTAIRADVRLLLAGQRARAGLGTVDEAEASAAEERVVKYEESRCS
jgi:hypothetical protein